MIKIDNPGIRKEEEGRKNKIGNERKEKRREEVSNNRMRDT